MRGFWRTGKNVNHARQCIRAPHRCAWAAGDFDALNQRQRQVRKIKQALCGRIHADAINQHQRMIGIAAAHEHRILRAAATRAYDIDAGLFAENIEQVDGMAGFNISAGQHGNGMHRLIGAQCDTAGGHLHAVERFGAVLCQYMATD